MRSASAGWTLGSRGITTQNRDLSKYINIVHCWQFLFDHSGCEEFLAPLICQRFTDSLRRAIALTCMATRHECLAGAARESLMHESDLRTSVFELRVWNRPPRRSNHALTSMAGLKGHLSRGSAAICSDEDVQLPPGLSGEGGGSLQRETRRSFVFRWLDFSDPPLRGTFSFIAAIALAQSRIDGLIACASRLGTDAERLALMRVRRCRDVD